MVNNLPDSDILDVRDYLFVDRQRVGSLLAQFADGLSETRTSSTSRSGKLNLSLQKMFALDVERGNTETQTLALADLHVSQLEEAAESLSMLADVSDLISTRKNWLRGKVRERIKPGMLLRVTAQTQIVDVSSIIDVLERIMEAFDTGSDQALVDTLNQASSLYGKSIIVSIRACGDDDFDTAFIGELPYDFEFGPMKRELLLSQVGVESVELTTLMQVSAVPTEREDLNEYRRLVDEADRMSQRLKESELLNRRILDRFLSGMGAILGEVGFISAPKWPAISVIPLAIYRNVLPLPSLVEE